MKDWAIRNIMICAWPQNESEKAKKTKNIWSNPSFTKKNVKNDEYQYIQKVDKFQEGEKGAEPIIKFKLAALAHRTEFHRDYAFCK